MLLLRCVVTPVAGLRHLGRAQWLTDDDPVSYTHLDVYKRQILGSMDEGYAPGTIG